MKAPKKTAIARALPWILIIGGIIGLISSFVITQDKMDLLKNPSFVPNCNLNPVISCGTVMRSAQGSVFGFPNPWIGLAAFAALITIGVGIFAGASFKRWFWLGLNVGVTGGLVFAYWLLFESVYRIHALCPYCLAVDVAVITTSWYLLLYSIEQKFVVLPQRFEKFSDFARRHHLDILVFWFLIIAAIILNHFWYYYSKYL